MSNNSLIPAWIGQFSLEPEVLFCETENQFTGKNALLRFLCTPTIPYDLQSVYRRFQEIDRKSPHMFFVPHENIILDRLYWPLRHAKASYILGNCLGTISLCGMVAEMVAILIFDINMVYSNESGNCSDISQRKNSVNFEKLGQAKRIKKLFDSKFIDEDIRNKLDSIRKIRNKYLHFFSQSYVDIEKESIEMFCLTANVILITTMPGYQDGAAVLSPILRKHLEQQGIL